MDIKRGGMMVLLECENPIKSCGFKEHIAGARYWRCSVCDAPGVNLR